MLGTKANIPPGVTSAIRRVARLLGTGQRAWSVVATISSWSPARASACAAPRPCLPRWWRKCGGSSSWWQGTATVSSAGANPARRPTPDGIAAAGWRSAPRGGPLISQEELAAGERLRQDFELAQLSPRVTALWGVEGAVSTTGGRRSGLPPDGLPTASACSRRGPALTGRSRRQVRGLPPSCSKCAASSAASKRPSAGSAGRHGRERWCSGWRWPASPCITG